MCTKSLALRMLIKKARQEESGTFLRSDAFLAHISHISTKREMLTQGSRILVPRKGMLACNFPWKPLASLGRFLR